MGVKLRSFPEKKEKKRRKKVSNVKLQKQKLVLVYKITYNHLILL